MKDFYAHEYIEMKNTGKKRSFLDILKGIIGMLVSLCIMMLTYHFRVEIKNASTLSYIGLLVACFAANSSVLFPASSSLIVIGAASALDPLLCGIIGGLGASFGEQVSYWMGRSGRQFFGDLMVIMRLSRAMDRYGFGIVFVFSLLPLPIYDLAGIAAGIAKYNWFKYTLACALGKIPKMIGYAYFGLYMLTWLENYAAGSKAPYAELLRKVFDLIR